MRIIKGLGLSKKVAYNSTCPNCNNKLYYNTKEKGYFCENKKCKYTLNNPNGRCFIYFQDKECDEMTLFYSQTVLDRRKILTEISKKKDKCNKIRNKYLTKIPIEFLNQKNKRTITENDSFYRAYVPFVGKEEVKRICKNLKENNIL